MKNTFKILKIINLVALAFILVLGYGWPITGGLQVLAAIMFAIVFPKNKLIYVYFFSVILFFLVWGEICDWDTTNALFLIFPLILVIFLTYIIYNQKQN